jgi:hypothetical protein
MVGKMGGFGLVWNEFLRGDYLNKILVRPIQKRKIFNCWYMMVAPQKNNITSSCQVAMIT